MAKNKLQVIRSFQGGIDKIPADRGFSRTDACYYDKVPKDMTGNLQFRKKLVKEVLGDAAAQLEIAQICSREPLFWLNVFGWTFDPRLGTKLQVIPFITFDVQDEIIYEIYQALGYYDLLIEKSRDEGASWLSMACLTHQWQFERDQQFSVTSRKGDLVDKTGNKDALFWKIMFLADHQPGWLKPFYEHNEMTLMHPDLDSTIIGESATGEVGRGGRNRAMFLDEFSAFNRDDGYKVESATASNTNCRIFNGTPRGTGNSFFDIRQALQEGIRSGKKLRIHWTEDPRKNMGLYISGAGYREVYPGAMDHERYDDNDIVFLDRSPCGREVDEFDFDDDFKFILDGKIRSPWYDNECKRYSHPMLVAQELDIDYHNSSFRFFDENVLQKILEEQVCEPYHQGEFKFDKDGQYLEWEEQENGPWRLWFNLDGHQRPPRHLTYVAGIDVALGTGASNSCISIGDDRTGEKVAEYTNPYVTPEDFGRLASRAHKLFNEAYMIWENNGPGRSFAAKLLEEGVSAFYHRRDDVSIKSKVSDIPGWASTKERKASLLGDYRDAQYHGDFTNPSYHAIIECREYVNLPDNTVKHSASMDNVDPTGAGSAHGDRVMADALCWKGMQELRRGNPVDEKQLELERNAKNSPETLAGRMAGIDKSAKSSNLWTELYNDWS